LGHVISGQGIECNPEKVAAIATWPTTVVEFGEAIKNPAYRILQTEYSGCLDISAHA